MKSKILRGIFLLLVATIAANAQVKIGNNPGTINSNSLVEMESTNKGLLAPRVALNDVNSIAPLSATTPEGMIVYSSGGILTNGFYFWNGVKWLAVLSSANVRSNYVLVKSASDFPAPSGGIITLTANTTYEINGTILLTNKIDLNGCTVIGMDRDDDQLIYTPTTGSLFTGSNGGVLSNLTLIAAGVGAKLFNLDALGDPSKVLLLEFCYILNCDNIGLIKGFAGYVEFQSIAFSNNTNGITFQDIGDYISISTFWVADNHNTYETYVGTFGTINMVGGKRQMLSFFSAKGLNILGITAITVGANIKNNMFVGDGTFVVGGFSNMWEVETYGLNTQKDDVATGNLYLTSNAQTTFTAVNTPTKILGTTTAPVVNLFRVTSPSNNRLTYTGNKTRRFQVIGSLTAIQVSSNIAFTFYIAKNGVILPESKQKIISKNAADQISLTISCAQLLAPNDYLEVWVEDNTNTTAVTIVTMNLAIQ